MRRRRIVQVVAAGATVAVLSGVAYAAPWNGVGGNQNGQLQVAAPPTTKQSAKPSPKPPAKPKLVEISPQATLQLLLDQLPKDVKTSHYSGSYAAVGAQHTGTYAALTYTDSTGAKTLMSVQLNWAPDVAENGNTLPCPEPFGAGDWYICDYQELPGGDKLRLAQDHEYPASANTDDDKAGPDGRGAKTRSASLLRRDGLEIYVWENNSSAEKDAPETRPAPPLSLKDLQAIVSSASWQTKLDADYVERAEKLFDVSE
ncbi:hypothetical protein GCM10027569_41240 [Flindersiella endophytica]